MIDFIFSCFCFIPLFLCLVHSKIFYKDVFAVIKNIINPNNDINIITALVNIFSGVFSLSIAIAICINSPEVIGLLLFVGAVHLLKHLNINTIKNKIRRMIVFILEEEDEQ